MDGWMGRGRGGTSRGGGRPGGIGVAHPDPGPYPVQNRGGLAGGDDGGHEGTREGRAGDRMRDTKGDMHRALEPASAAVTPHGPPSGCPHEGGQGA